MKKAFWITALIVTVPAIIAAAVLVNGFVLYQLWTWFAWPLGAPPINVAYAVGFAAIVAFLTTHNTPFPSGPIVFNLSECDTFLEANFDTRELIEYLHEKAAYIRQKKNERIYESISHLTVRPAVVLLIGWVAHKFI